MNKSRIFKAIIAAIIILIAATAASPIGKQLYCRSREKPPHYREIMDLMAPLEYTLIPQLTENQTAICINPAGRSFTIDTCYRFDDGEHILLHGGTAGICTHLALYVYEKIRPLLDNRFEISFCNASESSFFHYPIWNHAVLVITDTAARPPARFILDPSFKRYGRLDGAYDYLIDTERVFSHYEMLSRVQRNWEIPHDNTIPLTIAKNHLIGFKLKPVDDSFDENNFAIIVEAFYQYHYNGKILLKIKRKDGRVTVNEDQVLAPRLLGRRRYAGLKQYLLHLPGRKN